MKTRGEGDSFRRTSNDDEIETSGTDGGSARDDGLHERRSCGNHRSNYDQCSSDQCAQHDHGPNHRPTPTTVLDTDSAKVLDTDEAKIFIADAFFDARNAYDVEAATALIGPEDHVHDERDFITGVDMYPALFEWLRATGWKWTDDECRMNRGSGQYNVSCSYYVENAWSRAMGLSPVEDGVDFEIYGPMYWVPDFKVDQDDSASGRGGQNAQMVEVWEMVTDWIRANHPSDAGEMINEDGSAPVLDARSIDLWRMYTQEFVEFHTP